MGLLRKAAKGLAIAASPALRGGLWHGVAAAIEHDPFLSKHEFSTVIDAGANKGQFSLIARKYNPSAKIYAFEPLPSEADVFDRIFEDDELTHLYRYALGSSNTHSTINITGKADSSSLLPVAEGLYTRFPGTEPVGSTIVDVKRLDEVLVASQLAVPTLMKIDVQGFELEVLEGAKTLLDAITMLYVECCYVELYEGQPLGDEIIDWVCGHGFKKAGTFNKYYEDGKLIVADVAFIQGPQKRRSA